MQAAARREEVSLQGARDGLDDLFSAVQEQGSQPPRTIPWMLKVGREGRFRADLRNRPKFPTN